MTQPDAYHFVIHSRKDRKRVDPILKGLQARGVNLWADNMLQPGINWGPKVYEAVRDSLGLLAFVSTNSLHEPYTRGQLEVLSRLSTQAAVIALLEDITTLPEAVSRFDPINIAADETTVAIDKIMAAIGALPVTDSVDKAIGDAEAMAISVMVTDQKRGNKSPGRGGGGPPDSIFIVHGHDLTLRDEVDGYLNGLGVETVILSQIDVGQDSLFQKFLTFSEDVEFAVVLITADDYGASRRQFDVEGVADRALQFRARQNVILELGFFYGYLGWENVFVLFKQADRVFPNFEVPSDLGGILFDTVDGTGGWKSKLRERLQQAGFKIAAT